LFSARCGASLLARDSQGLSRRSSSSCDRYQGMEAIALADAAALRQKVCAVRVRVRVRSLPVAAAAAAAVPAAAAAAVPAAAAPAQGRRRRQLHCRHHSSSSAPVSAAVGAVSQVWQPFVAPVYASPRSSRPIPCRAMPHPFLLAIAPTNQIETAARKYVDDAGHHRSTTAAVARGNRTMKQVDRAVASATDADSRRRLLEERHIAAEALRQSLEVRSRPRGMHSLAVAPSRRRMRRVGHTSSSRD
jgi:hypothetical protein